MLDQVLGEFLKHRRVLITSLDNKNEIVITAIREELAQTETLVNSINEAVTDLRNRINGITTK